MSAAKHTPAPWVFVNGVDREIHANGQTIMSDTQYYPWCPDENADWKLIAAAPELLAALVDLQELAALLAANCTDRVDVTNDPRVGAARAAIAKATGEQQ